MKARASVLLALAFVAGPVAAGEREWPARPLRAERTIPDSVLFDQQFPPERHGNLVRMTVTNYGFYGNNFFSRDPSLEYPANRGVEHMVRGGLWVGGLASDAFGPFIGVTTGTVDAAQGPTSPEASEYTPGNRKILLRSKLPTSPYFSRQAVSEFDMISDFNDLTPTQAASNSEPHRSMKISVHHENYQWNYAEFRNILFFHIQVKNLGTAIDSMWIGIYNEFASGYKAGYVNWPPSGTDQGGLGSWFNNKWNVWDPSLSLLREHYCDSQPLPPAATNCKLDRAPYWIGLRYLGSRGISSDDTTRLITVSSWNWAPGNIERNEDRERYRLMSTGVAQDVTADSLKPGPGDPTTIYAVGPFPVVPHDATVSVDFAIVGGAGAADAAEIQSNSRFAQFAYDHDYNLPEPPASPRFHVVARDTALDFYWDNISESAYDITSPDPKDFEGYRVRMSSEDPDTLRLIAQFDAGGDTASYNTGFDEVKLATPVVIGGDTCYYKYTVRGVRDGFKYFCAVTAFDLGNSQSAPKEGGVEQNRVVAIPGPRPGERAGRGPTVFPNPYRVEALWDRGRNVRDHFLWFTNLPKRCRLKIFTLSGDLVFDQDFDGATYGGEGARGIYNPSESLGRPTLSGTTFGWNLITREGQAVATGLYLYTVEDRGPGGKTTVGKFLVVKSDREGF